MVKRPLLAAAVTFCGMLLVFFLFLLYTFDEGDSLFRFSAGESNGRIGLIRVEGVILGSDDVISQIKEFKQDPTIKAIILRINSPGGAVVPSQDIYSELKKIRDERKLKIIVSMGTVAASGGYYIAATADRIYASQGTLTGSIGVIMELPNAEKLMEKVGVESVVIKSGEFKDMGSVFRKIGNSEARILQDVVDDIYDQFIEAVAEGRDMSTDEIRRLAEGKVYTGRQALDVGLVDEIGNMEDAIEGTARMLGIKGRPIVVEKKKNNILKLLQDSRADSLWNRSTSDFFAIRYLFGAGKEMILGQLAS